MGSIPNFHQQTNTCTGPREWYEIIYLFIILCLSEKKEEK